MRHSHEPSLAQLRLAWWREQLQVDPAEWPRGEPLLAAVKSWQGRHGALVELVDGWEYLTGAAPLPEDDIRNFAEGRGAAFGGLAEVVGGDPAKAAALGRQWALADLASNVANPDERAAAQKLLAEAGRPPRLPRSLRPLAVLYGLALRRLQGLSPTSFLATLRLGLLGR